MKPEMDEDLFGQMVEAFHFPTIIPEPPTTMRARWQPNWTYNKESLDTNYFNRSTAVN